ncbi:uncharacterized protein ASCRUDRAFT_82002 [Ascoidea rubescens DSM 1968]|uniref:Uncharacterized protein n=1 Tax=Ascoidea rubescens DSM 1968 TaxID=1344418 RepID=A0A1D2VCG8_9ASCO|nr:hypothetical protein ASCRUDRAFT_82002 [Ascoidea rubescens DSM 1968]ODV59309.1 hypothetical protein ASCRUDRAFT_82002 [Ascoidea rubescens DSM 1968]
MKIWKDYFNVIQSDSKCILFWNNYLKTNNLTVDNNHFLNAYMSSYKIGLVEGDRKGSNKLINHCK